MDLSQAIARLLRGFTARMVLSAVVLQVLLLPILGWQIARIIETEQGSQFLNFARMQSSQFARAVEGAKNAEGVSILLDDFTLSGQVAYAEMISLSGVVITSATQAAGQKFVEDLHIGEHSDSTYFVALPLAGYDGHTKGHLRLGFDEMPFREQLAAIRLRLLWLGLGYLALSTLLIATIGRKLSSSVRQLRDAARSIAAGKHDVRLEVDTRITELKSLASNLETMRATLASAEEVAAAGRDAAQAASRSKSQFLANMSHEIRTPMNAVLGMAELLLDAGLNGQQRRFVQTIRSSADALMRLINDILDFSKIEAGKLELDHIDFDVHALVDDVAEMLAHRAHGKGIELACRIDSSVPQFLNGDRDRLRQVLVNLVGNAIKFTQQGHVLISAASPDADEPTRLQLTVTDTGIGMNEEHMARLFKAFSQGDGSMARRFGGTGLGLAIAKQLVELMGGGIDVSSSVDKGSRFSVIVSLATSSTAPTVTPGQDLSGMSVLVVDDNPTNREIIEHQLVTEGASVTLSCDAHEALQHLRSSIGIGGTRFQACVADMKMPGMSGAEMFRTMRAQGLDRNVRMILLTSMNIDAELARLREQADIALLSKPARRGELVRALLSKAEDLQEQPPAAAVVGKLAGTQATPGGERSANARIIDPRRILVAEDNPVNQTVIRHMLNSLGFTTFDIVENGLKAVDAVLNGKYDLVLMDCQMPEMDGFEASLAIRDAEASGTGQRLPIVALTANAMAGDRQQCIEAGMDDHLAKPYTRDALGQMMRRWLPPLHSDTGTAQTNVALGAASDSGANQALDESALDSLRALEIDGAGDIVDEVVGIYMGETPQRLAEIEAAVQADDAKRLSRAAHSLKSASFNVGAKQLGELARAMEVIGRAGDVQGAIELSQQAHTEYTRITPMLNRLRRSDVAS